MQYPKTNILDRGYVQLIEPWGSDQRVIESARMSTDKGFLGWGTGQCQKCMLFDHEMVEDEQCLSGGVHDFEKPGDEKLLKFLWTHKHATPFEFGGLIIEVQAPIMVFREWHRHRTQSFNEMSGRYIELPNMYYFPDEARILNGVQSKKNKQGSEGGFTEQDVEEISQQLRDATEYCRGIYEDLLHHGVAREIARLILPVNQYSRMRASANLRNWLAFLTLRTDLSAQWEIRQYANEVAKLVEAHFPRSYALFRGEQKAY